MGEKSNKRLAALFISAAMAVPIGSANAAMDFETSVGSASQVRADAPTGVAHLELVPQQVFTEPTVEVSPSVKLEVGSAAIKQAKSLQLMPETATAVTAKRVGDSWTIKYKEKEAWRYGTVSLDANTGQPTAFQENFGSTYILDGAPLVFLGEEKITYEEAAAIAEQYSESQGWMQDAEWMLDLYPQVVNLRFETTVYHKIRFDRSFAGIRYTPNSFDIWVDRETGEVKAHYVEWNETDFDVPKDMLPAVEAAAIFYREIDPFLQWSYWFENANDSNLLYAMLPVYTLDAGGELPKERNQENPPFTDKIKPAYPMELAKKRLLSLYDLELHYLNDAPGKASPYYQLRIKPGVPLFHSGEHPFIQARTGEWIDFGDDPVRVELPPASDWLIDAAVPESAVDYQATVVWNNKLLELKDIPIYEQGTILFPLRDLIAKLGANIRWDPVSRSVTVSKGGSTLELTIGSDTALVNGELKKLRVPARIENGRTYIPARLVLESLGAKVGWHQGSRLVMVHTDPALPELTAAEIGQIRFEAQLDWEEKMIGRHIVHD
ncbi:copper amine oxidase N-terminal domain-containing protein [Paenibacillus sp. LHD-117]|uniref:copper amine oxidase N-terminal domain-containing protein n=1 Tax=Paenibacillus sp. LHD-117 TaxID=3071412 RepID=UPI0027E173D2|nr:copper amine oxidase N-terminal domain-containing protein [Paenibacillus sp. LHD-117]MDQ6419460.1 copper amine oxidase N-terminal domain-containing protein [Paenibacillus sp. LHD-117]